MLLHPDIPAQMPRNLYPAKPLAPQLRLFHEGSTLQPEMIDENAKLSVLPKKSFTFFFFYVSMNVSAFAFLLSWKVFI